MSMSIDLESLQVIHYPDPRLRQVAATVTRFDDELAGLAARMFELMRAHKGVGLAAPQVGVSLRLFVMNATGDPGDDRALVNPEIVDPENPREDEEGCLSIPEVRVQVRRAGRCRIKAQDLSGAAIELTDEGLVARIWQHETDHLLGKLIIDRMGPADKIATRQRLRELEEDFRAAAGKR
jgi:peptide deformylase